MGHGNIDEGLAGFRDLLIVLAQATIVVQPSEGAFHDPPTGQHLESLDLVAPLDDFQQPTAILEHPWASGDT